MWVYMYNLPGCLPEMEPYVTNLFEDALSAMICDMEMSLEDAASRYDDYGGQEDGDEMSEWEKCVKRANCAGHRYDLVLNAPDGYVYSVTYDPEATNDD